MLVLVQDGIERQVNADLLPNLFDILAGRVGLVFAQLRVGMGHQAVVAIDGLQG